MRYVRWSTKCEVKREERLEVQEKEKRGNYHSVPRIPEKGRALQFAIQLLH